MNKDLEPTHGEDFDPFDLSQWPVGSISYQTAALVGSLIRSGMGMDEVHAEIRKRHNSFFESNRRFSRRELLDADSSRICGETLLRHMGYKIPEGYRIGDEGHERLVPVPQLADVRPRSEPDLGF